MEMEEIYANRREFVGLILVGVFAVLIIVLIIFGRRKRRRIIGEQLLRLEALQEHILNYDSIVEQLKADTSSNVTTRVDNYFKKKEIVDSLAPIKNTIKEFDNRCNEIMMMTLDKAKVSREKHQIIANLYEYKDSISNFEDYQIELLKSELNVIKQTVGNLRHKFKLINKYGEEVGMKIVNHEYFIGMTEEQLIDCKGNPTKKETEKLKTKTKEIYIYGNKSSGDVFVFVNGELERFKDR